MRREPTRGIKRYRENKRYTHADHDAALWLVKAARESFEPDFADYLCFCALGGFRGGELLRIEKDGMVESAGMCWRQVGKDTIKTEMGATESKDARTVPIPEPLRPVIAERRKRCFDAGGADGLVFDLNDQWLRRRWFKLLALAVEAKKLPASMGPNGPVEKRLRMHDWRRSFGVLVGEHAEPQVVMKLLGHRDIRTTMRYLEGTDKRAKEAVAAFGKAWGAG